MAAIYKDRLILKYLQMKSSFGWSLSNLAALVRQQLFIFRDLWAWLNNPMEGPPAARQLAEQLPMPLIWKPGVGQQRKCKHPLEPVARHLHNYNLDSRMPGT